MLLLVILQSVISFGTAAAVLTPSPLQLLPLFPSSPLLPSSALSPSPLPPSPFLPLPAYSPLPASPPPRLSPSQQLPPPLYFPLSSPENDCPRKRAKLWSRNINSILNLCWELHYGGGLCVTGASHEGSRRELF